MNLAAIATGRDNNLNLLRLLAAAAVLISHSFALSTGAASSEPLRSQLGFSLGSVAVDVFSIISGFLVTASIVRTQSLIDFATARFLRIFPGLIVMLGLTVFVLGPVFTKLQLTEYLSAKQTHLYLAKGVVLIRGVAYELPGVFSSNPFGPAVNGSLWTLPLEVKMYATLAVVWFACGFSRLVQVRLFTWSTFFIAGVAALVLLANIESTESERSFTWLLFMFFAGASCQLLSKSIKLSWTLAFTTLMLLVVVSQVSNQVFRLLYLPGVVYLALFFAYVPKGWYRAYNLVGDYSYGVYIYAFPIQQAIVATNPGVEPLPLALASLVTTLLVAGASWHYIEHPALGRKNDAVDALRRARSKFN